ncbi:methyltransferase domain-containing protein [Tunturiibacter gelidiferens]|uniref:class I SAM-dependent methyltransferase n=1 Tax=Tunturiibacter gelidiferens TaxID=3069689 RepID=UPI003D9B750A
MEHNESGGTGCPAGQTYLLDNAGKEASARFAALAAIFDPGTIRHLEERGLTSGWHCLEVGGGGGSIAAWLAARVGSTGRVLVTDIDPRFLESLQVTNLEVRRHNIVNDALPEAAFDLVHSRLVLLHLPERERALARMVAALKPGGWLVDEEFDSSIDLVSSANPGEVYSKTYVAMARTMDSRGVDRRFGRRLFGRLRAHGFVDVAAEGRTFMWHSGSPGVSLLRSNYEQLRSAMIDAGYITEREFNEDLAGLDDPGFMMPSPILWTVWGRRP